MANNSVIIIDETLLITDFTTIPGKSEINQISFHSEINIANGLTENTSINILYAPASTPLDETTVKGIITTGISDSTSGFYLAKYEHTGDNTSGIIKLDTYLSNEFANTPFYRYLYTTKNNDDNYSTYSGYLSGIWTGVPVVTFSNALEGIYESGTFKIKFYPNRFNNDNSLEYNGDPQYNISYTYRVQGGTQILYSEDFNYDIIESGIIPDFNLISYVENATGSDSTMYDVSVKLSYISPIANYEKTTSIINLDKFFYDMNYQFSNKIPSEINEDLLIKTNEVLIDNGTNLNNRKRLCIGIQDIAVYDNKYKKFGEYISTNYYLQDSLYTLSMMTDEYINDKDYEKIKYYIQINNESEWIRISPNNRPSEKYNNKIIPKLIIFDIASDEVIGNSYAKFINYQKDILSVKVKIQIDCSNETNSNFISPEVYDYKLNIITKQDLLGE